MDVSKVAAAKSGGSAAGMVAASPEAMTSRLNPFAPEWRLEDYFPNEDPRCLFLTFSNGYPLTECQITRFFTLRYGPCVERVYVHWPRPIPRDKRSPPALFGKVVFKASYMPILILRGQSQTRFWVEARPLWCKKFDPEKKKNIRAAAQNTANNTNSGGGN